MEVLEYRRPWHRVKKISAISVRSATFGLTEINEEVVLVDVVNWKLEASWWGKVGDQNTRRGIARVVLLVVTN